MWLAFLWPCDLFFGFNQVQIFRAAFCAFFMNRWKSNMVVPSCTLFVSHACLKSLKKLKKVMGSAASNVLELHLYNKSLPSF